MALQGVELHNGREDVDQLGHSSAKQVKLSENGSHTEIKVLALQQIGDLVTNQVILLLIGVVQTDAVLELLNQLSGVLVPDLVGVSSFLDSGLAVIDHLISDLDEQVGHLVSGVVVSGNGVNHLDGAHQGGKSINDFLRSTSVEGLNELFQSGQILDVILGLIELVGDADIDQVELRHELLVVFFISSLLGVLGSFLQQGVLGQNKIGSLHLLIQAGNSLHS